MPPEKADWLLDIVLLTIENAVVTLGPLMSHMPPAVLDTGAVLVAGGFDSSGNASAASEVYNPTLVDLIFSNGFESPP